jgi:hypothetical protein
MTDEWFAVAKRLPESTGQVLAYSKGEMIQVTFRKGYSTLPYFCKADESHLPDVTHWRPLLPRPE